jgi:enoyl-CoA hydratase
MSDTGYERIRYEIPAPGVARVTLARADKRNAQDRRMLYEIDGAYTTAMRDDAVKVVVLAADGPDFSSGHDLRDTEDVAAFDTVTGAGGFDEPGQHGHMAVEEEIYLGLCWRWRNLPKPLIAQVQGRVIAGGLMLVWPCDLIIASDDALFSDPVVAFGVNGHEFFVHAWELGARKAEAREARRQREPRRAGSVDRGANGLRAAPRGPRQRTHRPRIADRPGRHRCRS